MNIYLQKHLQIHKEVIEISRDLENCYDQIRMILCKETKEGRSYIIGYSFDSNYTSTSHDFKFFFTETHQFITADKAMPDTKYDPFVIFDDPFFAYIMECIQNGYKPVYFDIQLHVRIWQYIDDELDETDALYEKEVKEYLTHCHEMGINVFVLGYYGLCLLNDLYEIYDINPKGIIDKHEE